MSYIGSVGPKSDKQFDGELSVSYVDRLVRVDNEDIHIKRGIRENIELNSHYTVRMSSEDYLCRVCVYVVNFI